MDEIRYCPSVAGLTLALTIACLSHTNGPSAHSQETTQRAIKLPSNGDETPVLTFDSTGGYRLQPAGGFQPKPRLQIFADGTVLCGSRSPRFKDVKSQIAGPQLLQLLDFVVNKQRFYDISGEKIKRQIAATGDSIRVMDAATSKFTVNIERGSHKVNVYALQFTAGQFSSIPELQQLLEIEKRLNNVIAVANVGGTKEIERLLKAANERLLKQYPKLAPYTQDDIVSATRFSNGDFSAVVTHHYYNDKGEKIVKASVSVMQKKGKPPKYSFITLDPNRN